MNFWWVRNEFMEVQRGREGIQREFGCTESLSDFRSTPSSGFTSTICIHPVYFVKASASRPLALG